MFIQYITHQGKKKFEQNKIKGVVQTILDLYNTILIIADSKQSSWHYAQTAISGVVFS